MKKILFNYFENPEFLLFSLKNTNFNDYDEIVTYTNIESKARDKIKFAHNINIAFNDLLQKIEISKEPVLIFINNGTYFIDKIIENSFFNECIELLSNNINSYFSTAYYGQLNINSYSYYVPFCIFINTNFNFGSGNIFIDDYIYHLDIFNNLFLKKYFFPQDLELESTSKEYLKYCNYLNNYNYETDFEKYMFIEFFYQNYEKTIIYWEKNIHKNIYNFIPNHYNNFVLYSYKNIPKFFNEYYTLLWLFFSKTNNLEYAHKIFETEKLNSIYNVIVELSKQNKNNNYRNNLYFQKYATLLNILEAPQKFNWSKSTILMLSKYFFNCLENEHEFIVNIKNFNLFAKYIEKYLQNLDFKNIEIYNLEGYKK